MRCGIRQMILGANRFVELEPADFQAAVVARQRLMNALHIEEKFRLLLGNYAEFEEELLRLTSRQLIFGHASWGSMLDDLFEISRRLINLMTTSRLYIDQVKHDISDMYGKDSKQFETLENAFRAEYDKRLGYRVMEALRNLVQHQSLPIHGLNYVSSRTNSKPAIAFESICTPSIRLETLEEAGSFKASVLAELKGAVSQKKELDLKPLVREYVTGLLAAHIELQKLLEADIEAAETTFTDVLQRFEKVYSAALPGIALVEEEPDGITKTTLYLIPGVIPRRKELMPGERDFRRYFVSSQVQADAPPWEMPTSGARIHEGAQSPPAKF